MSRYYTPKEFADLRKYGIALGFRHVESGPLVRSSYHAHEQTADARQNALGGSVRDLDRPDPAIRDQAPHSLGPDGGMVGRRTCGCRGRSGRSRHDRRRQRHAYRLGPRSGEQSQRTRSFRHRPDGLGPRRTDPNSWMRRWRRNPPPSRSPSGTRPRTRKRYGKPGCS